MEQTQNWTDINNLNESDCKEEDQSTNDVFHKINMSAKAFSKECEDKGIPNFIAYYLPGKGYRYKAVFPEEIDTPELQSEYGKFKEFLRVCIGFNKADYVDPEIHA